MIKKSILRVFAMLTLIAVIGLTSCSDDDGNTTGNKISYNLEERSNSGIDGDIEFVELEDGSIQAEISLSGTVSGTSHPAHVHMNSAALGGGILVSLDPVDGETGSSVTIFDKTDDGTTVTFDMIDDWDAYVNVHNSMADLGTILAQGDIGSNVLTGEEKEYDLDERDVAGISGNIVFKQRKNGNTLAEINLSGTPDGGEHPSHIHMNSAAEGGGILVSLTPVDGTTGQSLTDIRSTDGGEALDYEDVLSLNAYVNVHLSADELGTIVAQGDIGTNEISGESITYNLDEKDVAGISGEVVFEERLDGTIKATISLSGTPDGGEHPAHIHENSAAEGGPIAVTFTPVDGTTGMSVTSIRSLDDGSAFTYEAVKNYDGYVNVHFSADNLGTIVAQGDIGIND